MVHILNKNDYHWYEDIQIQIPRHLIILSL